MKKELVTTENLDEIIREVRKEIAQENSDLGPVEFLLPQRIRKNTYKGKGRPKKTDYAYIEEIFKDLENWFKLELSTK